MKTVVQTIQIINIFYIREISRKFIFRKLKTNTNTKLVIIIRIITYPQGVFTQILINDRVVPWSPTGIKSPQILQYSPLLSITIANHFVILQQSCAIKFLLIMGVSFLWNYSDKFHQDSSNLNALSVEVWMIFVHPIWLFMIIFYDTNFFFFCLLLI